MLPLEELKANLTILCVFICLSTTVVVPRLSLSYSVPRDWVGPLAQTPIHVSWSPVTQKWGYAMVVLPC